MMKDLDEYQNWTDEVSEYMKLDYEIEILDIYPILGLAGEVGELVDKIKKNYRNRYGMWSEEFKEEIKKELGDILFYFARIAKYFGWTISEIAELNKQKLLDRKKRGVICSEGDNR